MFRTQIAKKSAANFLLCSIDNVIKNCSVFDSTLANISYCKFRSPFNIIQLGMIDIWSAIMVVSNSDSFVSRIQRCPPWFLLFEPLLLPLLIIF